MANDQDKAKFRYPQQHVRPGRGVPGFTGNVEVIPTNKPDNQPVVVSTGDKPQTVEAKQGGLAERQALVARAKELGIPANGKSAELKAAIAEAEAAG